MSTMRWIVVRPNAPPELVEVDARRTVAELQRLVGGSYFCTAARLSRSVMAWCHDEGLLIGLPYCRTLGVHDIAGPIVVTGEVEDEDGIDVASLSHDDEAAVLRLFRECPLTITRADVERCFRPGG